MFLYLSYNYDTGTHKLNKYKDNNNNNTTNWLAIIYIATIITFGVVGYPSYLFLFWSKKKLIFFIKRIWWYKKLWNKKRL